MPPSIFLLFLSVDSQTRRAGVQPTRLPSSRSGQAGSEIEAIVNPRRRAPLIRLALHFLFWSLSGVLLAASPQEVWRGEAARIRVLAENDVPLAYEQVQLLQAALPTDPAPEDRARLLNLQSRIEIYLAKTSLAKEHALAALTLAKENADGVGQAEAYLNLNLIAIDTADIDLLVEAAAGGVKALDGVDRPDLLGEALLRSAMMYNRLGKIPESVAVCVQTMEIARQSNDPFALAYAHQGLAISYTQSGNHREAAEQYRQMREQAHIAQTKFLEAQAISSLGAEKNQLGDSSGGEALIQQSIAMYREIGAPFAINSNELALASLYVYSGRYVESLELLDDVVATYEKYPSKIAMWWTLKTRSTSYLALGRLADAQADAERGLGLAHDIGLPLYLGESTRTLADIAARLGQYQHAYELRVEATDIEAKAAQEKASSRTLELVSRYESEGQRRQIEELTRNNERQSAELRQRSLQQRWLWTVLGSSLLTLLGLAYFLVRLRRSHEQLQATNTQLHRSETELQSQTGILQSILDSMGEGVVVANERGELQLMNPAAKQLLGHGLSLGEPVDRLEHFELYRGDQTTLVPLSELPLARAIRNEPCDNVELFVRNQQIPDGRWLSITARPLKDQPGATRGGVAVMADITARKHAEAALRESQLLYLSLVEQMPAGIYRKDREGRFVYVSPWFCQLKGVSPEFYLGQTVDEVAVVEATQLGQPESSVEKPAPETLHHERIVQTGVRIELEEEYVDSAGRKQFVHVVKIPVRNSEGLIVGSQGILFDITARIQAEEEVHRLNATLEQRVRERTQELEVANRELEAFAYSVSHDLRAPLRHVDGYVELLLSNCGSDLSEQGHRYLDTIANSAHKMGDLIDDLLHFSRTSRTRMSLTTLNMSEAVQGALDDLKDSYADRSIEWVIGDMLPVQGDFSLIRQVWINLLGNALKYTRQRETARIQVSSWEENGETVFSVADNGAGFDMRYVDDIFGVFKRLHSAEEFEGTGIGLAIVHRIVTRHGGRIWAEGEIDKGATFYFALPHSEIQELESA